MHRKFSALGRRCEQEWTVDAKQTGPAAGVAAESGLGPLLAGEGTAGYQRFQEERRVLVDERIPLNAKQIQHAASFGDLSENSEWESAIEEQRKLTARAEDMHKDLRRARLIEDQTAPEGVVAPGTCVRLTILETGERSEYRIVGPWDAIAEGEVNYLAPIAQAFLGKSVGDEGEIESPEQTQRFRVDAIERIV